MVTDSDIEKFYADVNALKLRFPVAAIMRATGFSKSNVSQYLNKKQIPSENFLETFYKNIDKLSSKNVPHENNELNEGNVSYGKEAAQIRDLELKIKDLKEQINSLQKDKEELRNDKLKLEADKNYFKQLLEEKLKAVDANFQKSSKNQQELLAQTKSAILVAARIYAGSDNKKFLSVTKEIYNISGVALGQDADTGKRDGS